MKNINILRSFAAFAILFSTTISSVTFAQSTQTVLYQEVQKVIFDNVLNIAIYILVPIGVLMIVINIILILWALIAGEQGKVGAKIAAIMTGFILVVIGVGIATNKDKIFMTPALAPTTTTPTTTTPVVPAR